MEYNTLILIGICIGLLLVLVFFGGFIFRILIEILKIIIEALGNLHDY